MCPHPLGPGRRQNSLGFIELKNSPHFISYSKDENPTRPQVTTQSEREYLQLQFIIMYNDNYTIIFTV